MSRKAADTYTASVTRLKALVGRLESAQVDVDKLELVVKESVELATACRARLRSTQESVDTLLAGLQDASTPPQPAVVVPDATVSTPSTPPVTTSTMDDDFDPSPGISMAQAAAKGPEVENDRQGK